MSTSHTRQMWLWSFPWPFRLNGGQRSHVICLQQTEANPEPSPSHPEAHAAPSQPDTKEGWRALLESGKPLLTLGNQVGAGSGPHCPALQGLGSSPAADGRRRNASVERKPGEWLRWETRCSPPAQASSWQAGAMGVSLLQPPAVGRRPCPKRTL